MLPRATARYETLLSVAIRFEAVLDVEALRSKAARFEAVLDVKALRSEAERFEAVLDLEALRSEAVRFEAVLDVEALRSKAVQFKAVLDVWTLRSEAVRFEAVLDVESLRSEAIRLAATWSCASTCADVSRQHGLAPVRVRDVPRRSRRSCSRRSCWCSRRPRRLPVHDPWLFASAIVLTWSELIVNVLYTLSLGVGLFVAPVLHTFWWS